MPATALNKNTSPNLEQTIRMLEVHNDEELGAIQSVARTFIVQSDGNRQFSPQSEEELLSRIDRSLENIKAGRYRESEIVEKEMLEKYHLE